MVSTPAATTGYSRHRPEKSVLYRSVADELESFLAESAEQQRPVPLFAERALREFLSCGILAHGFVRVHCDACGHDRVVAFSCKRRGFCPSCAGRRMSEVAAHLAGNVLPEVPIRQWVLTLPWPLRYRVAYDSRLLGEVLNIFVRSVFASLRARARAAHGSRSYQCGAITFVQRFGGAVNLNPHFHTLVLDGVYDVDEVASKARFIALPPPSDDDIERVLAAVARKTLRLLERRGLGDDCDASDDLPLREPLLAELYGAALRGSSTGGARVVQPGASLIAGIEHGEAEPASRRALCANSGGLSLHANVAIAADQRDHLERLCRYAGRPPIATERLARLDDGRLLYSLRHRWRDGTTAVILKPRELLTRLVALVPWPRAHQLRYHGILAPAASWRNHVVPNTDQRGTSCAADASPADQPSCAEAAHPAQPVRIAWANLMKRVFAIDVLECPRCFPPMRVLSTIEQPQVIVAILECLGLPAHPPPIAPARKSVDTTGDFSFS